MTYTETMWGIPGGPSWHPAGGIVYVDGVTAFLRSGDGTQLTPTWQPLRSDPGGGCTLWGISGRDVLVGTPHEDVICGLGGNDTVLGLDGHDVLRGGNGNDWIAGG